MFIKDTIKKAIEGYQAVRKVVEDIDKLEDGPTKEAVKEEHKEELFFFFIFRAIEILLILRQLNIILQSLIFSIFRLLDQLNDKEKENYNRILTGCKNFETKILISDISLNSFYKVQDLLSNTLLISWLFSATRLYSVLSTIYSYRYFVF